MFSRGPASPHCTRNERARRTWLYKVSSTFLLFLCFRFVCLFQLIPTCAEVRSARIKVIGSWQHREQSRICREGMLGIRRFQKGDKRFKIPKFLLLGCQNHLRKSSNLLVVTLPSLVTRVTSPESLETRSTRRLLVPALEASFTSILDLDHFLNYQSGPR